MMRSLLQAFPDLERRLQDAPLASSPRSSGPLCRAAKKRYSDGVILIGDAGGYLDACTGEGLSLGQKQIVAFMRAVLREPDLLILDEATANIDTVTEQLLEQILRDLPASTTKVVIAHRLNTIANADEILFINAGEITRAGSMQDALDLLLHHKRES